MIKRHPNLFAYGFALALVAVVLAAVVNDRVQVEHRLDDRDDRLAETDRRLRAAIMDIRATQRDLADAIRRLERLEHPTRLDLQRLFRGLLEAAEPRDVRRLVRRLRELGVVLPIRRRGGGEAPGGGGPPPGPHGPP